MKKTVLTILTAIICNFLWAQFQKGNQFVSGNLGFNVAQNDTDVPMITQNKNTGLNGGLSWLKFQSPKVASGFMLQFSSLNQSFTNNNGKQENTQFGYGIGYLRSYFKPLNHQFYLVGNAMANLGFSNQRNSSTNTSQKTNVTNIGVTVGAGVGYQLSNQWLFEVGIPAFVGVNYSTSKFETITNNATVNKGKGQSFAVQSNINNQLIGQLNLTLRYKIR